MLPLTFGLYPNGSGNYHFIRYNGQDNLGTKISNGCFELEINYKDRNMQTGSDFGSTILNFSLQKSNSIYGASQHVQPQAVQLLTIIKS